MQRDQQAATAAAAKQQLVAAVEVLRQELAVMLREEEGKPPAARLPAEAFHLDQGELDALRTVLPLGSLQLTCVTCCQLYSSPTLIAQDSAGSVYAIVSHKRNFWLCCCCC
jgi:hypothetical protein